MVTVATSRLSAKRKASTESSNDHAASLTINKQNSDVNKPKDLTIVDKWGSSDVENPALPPSQAVMKTRTYAPTCIILLNLKNPILIVIPPENLMHITISTCNMFVIPRTL